jgi:MFS family permease
MLFGAIGLTISYLVLSTLLRIQASPALVSLFVLISIGIYGTSLAPVTWVLISEIFPNRVRGKASSIAVVALWVAYFILVLTFPVMAENLGTYGPFYVYAGVCLIGFLFIKRRVKETKGKTLEELEKVMAG